GAGQADRALFLGHDHVAGGARLHLKRLLAVAAGRIANRRSERAGGAAIDAHAAGRATGPEGSAPAAAHAARSAASPWSAGQPADCGRRAAQTASIRIRSATDE